MNWTHFLLWLAGGYSLYYLVIILADLSRSKRQELEDAGSHELTFAEQVTPIQMTPQAPEPVNFKNKPEVIASGGVLITDLFRLAKQEAIIYTRGVSF